jgi:hypothetical protein
MSIKMQDSDIKIMLLVTQCSSRQLTLHEMHTFPFEPTKLVKHQLFGMAACLLTRPEAKKASLQVARRLPHRCCDKLFSLSGTSSTSQFH